MLAPGIPGQDRRRVDDGRRRGKDHREGRLNAPARAAAHRPRTVRGGRRLRRDKARRSTSKLMSDLEFWSENRTLGVRIGSDTLMRILESCRRSDPEETGGILVGYYTETLDCAVVTDASERPPDSRSGRTRFVRGTAGLQRWLDGLWRRSNRRYYLGEWHYHPGGKPEPSPTDKRQMERIAGSASYKCPEPMLLLVGGSASDRCDVGIFVFVEGREAPVEVPMS